MASLFFIFSFSILSLCLAYAYFKSRNQMLAFKNKLTHAEAEVKTLRSTEQKNQDEIALLQNKLRHTFEDPITHLLGWQVFEDRLNQNIKESGRYQLTLGVLFVDIDDFKVINDGLSYEVGDALLQEVGQRLQACIRQVDSISRFTKDTFVILLTQLAKPETAAVVAQRMLQSLSKPFHIQQHELYITACIGVSIYPTDGQEVPALLRSADHALHLAKEKGKHLYQFYQEKLHAQSQRELVFYTNLNRESVFKEFVLYYQPIVNIQDENIFCLDALLYWQHPQLGLIHPQELFNYADKQGKLNLIAEWLLQNACKQFLHWRSLGFAPHLLGIPLSIKQLEHSHFIYRFSQILQETGMKPEWILLEIKDSFVSFSLETLEKAFNMLNYLGVKIAIDDFGSGNFSLAHLKTINTHYLKLDKALIADIATNPQTTALIKSILFLAQTMQLEVIIQGVESDDQMQSIKALNCTLMQGQLLSAPLSSGDMEKKMVTSS